MRILIVEDDPQFRAILVKALETDGHVVESVATVESACSLVAAIRYDLVVLDLALPDGTGLDVLDRLRATSPGSLVIFVSGVGELDERVEALNRGADDFIQKPFALSELQARVRALVRRGKSERTTTLRHGELEVDRVARTARRGERVLELTNLELDLLAYLVDHAGRVASRDELLREVWREERPRALMTNVVDVCVRGLRDKLRAPGEARELLIKTVRGAGYMLGSESDTRGGSLRRARD